MAYNNKKNIRSPTIDAGYGLIFRLNWLWAQADMLSLKGELDHYNFVLDRVWVNLGWRDEMEYVYAAGENPRHENAKITDVDFNTKEAKVFIIFKSKIKRVKAKIHAALKSRNRAAYVFGREEYYNILMMKDVWLRKVMNEKGLYLKESEFDPSRAMFGG